MKSYLGKNIFRILETSETNKTLRLNSTENNITHLLSRYLWYKSLKKKIVIGSENDAEGTLLFKLKFLSDDVESNDRSISLLRRYKMLDYSLAYKKKRGFILFWAIKSKINSGFLPPLKLSSRETFYAYTHTLRRSLIFALHKVIKKQP